MPMAMVDRHGRMLAEHCVSALPEPGLPAYVEPNGRLGWNVTERAQLAVSARNLMHTAHREYTAGA